MECRDFSQFLSEYIDGALNDEMKKSVEEHLSICKKCSEKLESLEAYVKALNSLEEVKAPDNFLAKVYESLERRRLFKRRAYKLFVPMRIKIPLELVGAAAMVILVIYIFNTMQPMRKIAVAPFSVTEPQKIAEKKWEENDLSGSAVEEEREKPIEVALLIKLDEFRKEGRGVGDYDEYERLAKEDKLSYERAEEKVKTFQRRDVKAPGELSLKADMIEKFETKETLELKKAPTAPLEEKSAERTNELLLQYSNETLSKVKNLIELAAGKVISIEYEKDTNLPQFILAGIPAENYNIFLEKLSQFGQVQEPLPSISAKDKGTIVQLRIALILSK